MSVGTRAGIASVLEKATEKLQSLAHSTEIEVALVAKVFQGLAVLSDKTLSLAADIIACVEDEKVVAILPKVQALGGAARSFIGERLQAVTGILETVTTEVKLLQQLSLEVARKTSIVRKTRALCVLTNIEVAVLGAIGTEFQYFANELGGFSTSLIEDSRALARSTADRKTTIEATKRVLSAELPRLREKLAVCDAELEKDLASLDSSLTHLSTTPVEFRTYMEDLARQITGVVAAVQAHDITRQQIEHVMAAFEIMSSRIREDGNVDSTLGPELSLVYAGLSIQIYQLKSIREAVATWTSQINLCMQEILKVNMFGMVGIGPAVLKQEHEVSAQLAHIAVLESEGQAYSGKIQSTVEGLSTLIDFVSEHLRRSESVRKRLQLLSFNSIIGAIHLGKRGSVVLAIAMRVKEISGEWEQITAQSEQTMQEMMKLVKRTTEAMEAFSEESSRRLRDAQTETKCGLDNLRTAAQFAAGQADEMKGITDKIEAQSTKVGDTGNHLEMCFGGI